MSKRRLCDLAALLAGLLLGMTLVAPLGARAPAAASASTGTPAWGPMRLVGSGLHNPVLAPTTEDGVWGVGNVGSGPTSHMAVVHRPPGGAWNVRGLPLIGRPLAVADDGRTTFVLYGSYAGCGILCRIHIVRVPHGGTPSVPRLLDRTDGDVAGASLVARDGQWWAVWAGAVKKAPNPRTERDYGYYVHEARTLGTAYGTRTILAGGPEVRAAHPQLVFRGRYQVLLKLDRPRHIEFWVAGLPGGMLQRTSGRITSDGHVAGVPSSITTSGTRTLVALSRWSDRRLIVAQDRSDLRFTERVIPTRRSTPPYPRIATSLGRVFVSHGDCSSLTDCRGYVATGALTGGFSSTDVTAPLAVPGQTDLRFGITALTASRGRATVLFDDGSARVYVRTQR